jgi:hypothetical protein
LKAAVVGSCGFALFLGASGLKSAYRIESKDLKEQRRDPILLPLAVDNTAVLRVRPPFADRACTLHLRLGTDNLLAGALVK